MGKLIKIVFLSMVLFFIGYFISDWMGKAQYIKANLLSFLALRVYYLYLVDIKKWNIRVAMKRAWLLVPLQLLYFSVICATGLSRIFPFDMADLMVIIQHIYYFYIAFFLTIGYILQIGEKLSKEKRNCSSQHILDTKTSF